jgi:hypothetical protein
VQVHILDVVRLRRFFRRELRVMIYILVCLFRSVTSATHAGARRGTAAANGRVRPQSMLRIGRGGQLQEDLAISGAEVRLGLRCGSQCGFGRSWARVDQ